MFYHILRRAVDAHCLRAHPPPAPSVLLGAPVRGPGRLPSRLAQCLDSRGRHRRNGLEAIDGVGRAPGGKRVTRWAKVAHGSRLARRSGTHEESGTSPKSVSRNSTALIMPYGRAWKHTASTWREPASSPEKYEPRSAPWSARSAKFVASKANFERHRPNRSARSTANVASKANHELRSRNSSARSLPSEPSDRPIDARSLPIVARSFVCVRRSLLRER